MACAQVRTLLQKRLVRAIPLEMIGTMTVGGLRALAEEAGASGALGSIPWHAAQLLCGSGAALPLTGSAERSAEAHWEHLHKFVGGLELWWP